MAWRKKVSLQRRFEEKFIIKISGCWEWIAATMGKGYGYFRVENKLHGAHRVAYELYIGPITGNNHVLHKCDNPLCVNPDHLFLGSNADNVKDMVVKGKAYDVPIETREEIKKLYNMGGRTHKGLALVFGCSQATVQRIVAKN